MTLRRSSALWTAPLGLVLAAALAAVSTDACVIADPPSDLTQLPEFPPSIVRGSVVPSASAVLAKWPTKFIVPVELVDPRAPIFYSAFVDYNPITGEGIDGASPAESDYTPGSTIGNVRTLEILVAEPPAGDLYRCHVVEIIVALHLTSTADSRLAHSPAAPGGDSVTWFFNPSGDLAGCPEQDAGPVEAGALPDGAPVLP
jgi:hypothetical protein